MKKRPPVKDNQGDGKFNIMYLDYKHSLTNFYSFIFGNVMAAVVYED